MAKPGKRDPEEKSPESGSGCRFGGFVKRNWFYFFLILYILFIIIAQFAPQVKYPPCTNEVDNGFAFCHALACRASLSSQLGYASGIFAIIVGTALLPLSSFLVDDRKSSNLFIRYRNFFLMIVGSASIALGGLFVLRAGDDVELARAAKLIQYFQVDVKDKKVDLDDKEKLIRCNRAEAIWLNGRSRYNKFAEKMDEAVKGQGFVGTTEKKNSEK